MNEKDIIREAMKEVGWTQEELRKKLGYTSQSSVSSRINGASMRVDTLVRFLDVMGYEVVVKRKKSGGSQWTIEHDEDE